ncbi:6-bladed beta-propeller, partial [Thermodesulfobacteriota bacterium]
VGRDGAIYTSDEKKGIIQVFRPDHFSTYPPWDKALPLISVKWLTDIEMSGAGKGAWDDKQKILYVINKKKKSILRYQNGEAKTPITIDKCRPIALDIDHNGFLWVLDAGKKRVLKLDANGKVLMEFGSSGSSAGKFSKPTDIAISSTGIIYVSDRGNEWVQAFNNDGIFLNALRETTGKKPLEEPIALSINSDDILAVLDEDKYTVTLYSSEGKPLLDFGKEGELPDEFEEPVDLYMTKDEIFILDTDSNNVKVFDLAGSFVRKFGVKGSGKGDFDEPHAITPLGNTVFAVADADNKRIQIITNVHTPIQAGAREAIGRMHAVSVTWETNPESFVSSYLILRSETEDADFQTIGTTEENTFLDTELPPGKTLYYRIAAVAENGNTGRPGNVVSAAPLEYLTSAPQDLTATPSEWTIILNWTPIPDHFVIHYTLYKEVDGEIISIGTSDLPTFTDSGLMANTSYTYQVASVSSDGLESERSVIKTATKTSSKPPLGIDVLTMQDIFSNTYKIYENDGMGNIRITNNTGEILSKIKVSFTLKNFMDFPSEKVIDSLEPGASEDFVLKAVFNNNILTVTEDTPVQTEIRASYYRNNEQHSFNNNHTVNIYEKHRMTWDEKGRFATFITPKDPLLLEFIRSVVTQYADADDTIQRAAAIFRSLGVMGVTYMQDPSNPYQMTSGITDFIDYIQYPRETLQRKSGDCDDLVALIAAALESLGIHTYPVEIPGHMLLMFDTGLPATSDGYTMDDLFVIKDGMLWIPVETTLIGSSFITAWEKGSRNYYAWKDQGLTLLDIRSSWGTYKPASLPGSTWRPSFITRETIEQTYHNEFLTIRRISVQTKVRKYLKTIESHPNDVNALQQV